MKLLLSLVFFVFVWIFSGCSKSTAPLRPVNCDSLITDTLGSNDSGRIFMPNAFTPNSDGLNEMCLPFTQHIDSIQFTLYDENNTVVFTTKTLGKGWQPDPGGAAVKKYYYRIQATTSGKKKIGICGVVYALTCYTINPSKNFYYFEDMLTPAGFTGMTQETLAVCK